MSTQSSPKLSFKQYWESKEALREAGNKNMSYLKTYKVNKYCKVPVFESNRREYLNLKPKDLIELEWEYDSLLKTNKLKKFSIIEEENKIQKCIVWNSKKIAEWVNSSTFEVPLI